MEKFSLLYAQLRKAGIADNYNTYEPQPACAKDIEHVHDREYVRRFLAGTLSAREIRRTGLPWSEALRKRTCTAVGGTLATARLALRYGIASNCAGGTHHAFPDFGAGFCIFNDLAIAASILLASGEVKQLLIVDLDVHQGDGTAVELESESRAFTFSMHCGSNFPFRKQHSDRDVELEEGMDDRKYLSILARELPSLLIDTSPDLVLYDAGVDVHSDDRLGKLSLSDDGIYRRDRYVIETARSCGAAVATVIGGGYDRDISRLAGRHAITLRAARDSALLETQERD